MPTTKILTAAGKDGDTVELADAIFDAPVNETLIHQAVIRQLAARRVGTSDTLTRGEVAGGGKKPWRQKGTGRARQGTRTAPHWKGGGVVFGPHPRDHENEDEREDAARRAARRAHRQVGGRCAARGRRLRPRRRSARRQFLGRLGGWKAEGKVLLVLAARDEIVERSARNLPEVRVILADSLNVVDLLGADTIVLTRDALDRVQEVYA